MVPLDTTPTANTTKIVTPLHTHTTKVRVANNVTSTSSQAEIAKYHHQSLGSSPKSTLLKAIKNHSNLFNTFPGLSYKLINKHLPLSTATMKGHMIQKRQGLQSTNNNREAVRNARKDVQDMSPTEHVCTSLLALRTASLLLFVDRSPCLFLSCGPSLLLWTKVDAC